MSRLLHVGLVLTCLAAPGRAADGPAVAYFTPETIAEKGRTRVIAFRVSEAPAHDTVWPVDVVGGLEVVTPPAVLAGERIGFVRVRGVSTGDSTLTFGGEPLRVAVREPRTAAEGDTLQIDGPAEGAVVHGRTGVGVRVWDGSREPASVVLITPDGAIHSPTWESPPAAGPRRHAMFEVDFDTLEPGPALLSAVLLGPDGSNAAQRDVTVRVVRPEPAQVTAGEAEERYEVERPKRFEQERRARRADANASGGAFFDNAGSIPAVCFPVEVAEPGWYQVFVTAGGDMAAGALPTIGVVIDGADTAATNGRLLAPRWHRIAVGIPVRLEAGRRIITPYFENDFYAPDLADRNLRLDRLEVVRLGSAVGGGNDGEGMMGAMTTRAMAPAPEPVQAATGAMSGGMMSGPPGGWAMPVVADAYGVSEAPLRIATAQPLDGLPLSGGLEVDAFCWWQQMESSPPPIVSLVINGRIASTQRAGGPRFWIDAAHFAEGENTVQLLAAFPSGARAQTPAQRVLWSGPTSGARARVFRRFGIQDDAWDEATRGALRREHWPREARAAGLFSAGRLTLTLPENLTGQFDVFLELRGDQFRGAPIARATLQSPEASTEIGTVEAPGWWDTRRAGEAALALGAKSLTVEFTNDLYEPDKGDRNLWLQALILSERPDAPDTAPPSAEILHPRQGQETRSQDAVVARVRDDRGAQQVELLLDGRPTGVTQNLRLRPGLVALPLPLRGVEPGEHTVALRTRDAAENEADSAPVGIVVREPQPRADGATPYERAVALLDRFGFGPDPRSLADILVKGERAWLEESLSAPADDPGDAAALGAALARFPNRGSDYEVSRRALMHAVLTPNPARARFVLWAQNHFSTWIRKTEAPRKWDEHVAFARLGVAPFPDLLAASARSPAMLRYLDQEQSFSHRLNENYAREVMELHTVGVDGGYTQADVTALARLLTGWTSAREGDGRSGGYVNAWCYAFDPSLNEPGPQRIFGMAFPECPPRQRYERALSALEMLAARPQTAEFVCRKLCEHYAATPAPEDLVSDLSRVFLETYGDMKAVLLAMAEHPAFWAAATERRLAHPLDFALRLCRTTGHQNPWELGDFLQRSGVGLFDRPTPDGYPPEDSAYGDSNAMIQRWKYAESLRWPLTNCVPERWRWPPEPLAGDGAQRIIDAIAVRITGRSLGEESNLAALDLAVAIDAKGQEAIQILAPFIASTPEANER